MAGFYEPEILSRVQQMELEILKDVMELCDSHGLLCFGMAGTAIGAIRHKGFIPWAAALALFVPAALFPGMMTLTLPCQGRILSAF